MALGLIVSGFGLAVRHPAFHVVERNSAFVIEGDRIEWNTYRMEVNFLRDTQMTMIHQIANVCKTSTLHLPNSLK